MPVHDTNNPLYVLTSVELSRKIEIVLIHKFLEL